MPEIGEVRNGHSLGYKSNNNHIWLACLDCDKGRWVRNTKCGRSHRCASCSARKSKNWPTGEKSHLWKGGRTIHGNGYVMIRLSRDDFFYLMTGSNGYVFEHRLVVAKALGRCLHPWEIVHHKGVKYPKGSREDKADNRYPENLQLVSDDKHKQITIMENRINHLEKEVKLLRWQISELNKIKGGVTK